MKNIVFLVGSYYPNYSAVGRCQGNLANEFERRGYNVTVIAQKTISTEKTDDYIGNQHIIRIGTKDSESDLYCREQLKKGNTKYLLRHRLYQFKRLMRIVFSKDSLDKKMVNSYCKALSVLESKPDIIIPTCLPFETVQASLLYKKCNGDCKIIPVLYDMFSDSQTLHRFDWNKKLKMKANLALEKKMLQECLKIMHVPSWSKHFKEKFGDLLVKTEEIEHPLIVSYFPTRKDMYDDQYINLVYAGVVDLNLRDPQYALDLFSNSIFDNTRVHFYSLGSAQNKVDSAADACPWIYSYGQVTSDEAHEAMCNSDILISLGNRNNTQMPSKIFEYMSVGKPIIHFSYNDADLVCGVLEKYPLSHIVLMSKDNMAERLTDLKKFIDSSKGKCVEFEKVQSCFRNADVENIVVNMLKKCGGVHLICAGVLMNNYVEPDYLLKLIKEVKNKLQLKISFYSSGNAVGKIEAYSSFASNYGWIQHDELVKNMKTANILVNIAQKAGKQISSKIFEYMNIGKPILHIYYSNSDINLPYLRRYPLACCIKADDELFNENVDFFEKWCISNCIAQLDYGKVAEIFEEMTPKFICDKLIKEVN